MKSHAARTSRDKAVVLAGRVLALAVVAVTAFQSTGGTREPDAAGVGVITDREGVAARRGVLASRWEGADAHTRVEPGDWLKTGARGANALAVQLSGGARLLLGPATRVEVTTADRVTLSDGELEVTPASGGSLVVAGPASSQITVSGRAVLRARDGQLLRLDADPRWLTGYRDNASTEAMGSLLANVDGRNVPLTMGYHQVTVDIRDQIARTVIEESFENHTSSVLEGVFYFPLPADASISGFGMWVNGELVQGEIVEKQRAREIYETILREKRDPGLLEWAGGNIFKARVYPIGSEKRIRISYTQVLPKKGDSYRWNYALQSDLLRQHPLRRLRIQVDVSSTEALAAVTSTTHDCRVRTTEHAASLEFEADEYSPDRDFEVRVTTAATPGTVTVVPHRRGDDGYFMLLVNPPELPTDTAARESSPLDLLIVADTSLSMRGAARDNQIAFIEALLGALGDDDRFNLVTCDVESRWVFDAARPNSAAARSEAIDFLEKREALGWSDLDTPLRGACDRAGEGTHVIYVGDGAPTAGDPDPNAFARRVAQYHHGKGTFHVVVPGSTGEPAVWNAIAALGSGTVRSIASGDDPTAVAFEWLAEVSQPTLKDLRVSFEGMSAAAVYPDPIPNVPVSRQQIAIGRFDPLAGDEGKVTVRGTLDGKPVEMQSSIRVEGADSGNSFLPRLWARRHLDRLLSQGSSADVRNRVIALSEEFQIITPYTSFLVLESDEDRERFQVEKRLRMRDGEEFFAAGRDAARFELLREQMLAAKSWRTEQQAELIKWLSGMARETTEWLRRSGPVGGGGLRTASSGSVGFLTGSGRKNALMTSTRSLEEGEWTVTADTGVDADGADPWLAVEEAAPEPAFDFEPMEEFDRRPADAVRNARVGQRKKRTQPRAERAWSNELRQLGYLGGSPRLPSSSLDTVFPPVPVAVQQPSMPETTWPAEVVELLSRVDRKTTIEARPGGFSIEVNTTSRDPRGRTSTSRSDHFLGRGVWLQTTDQHPGMDYTVDWLYGGQRGVLGEMLRLGRTRDEAEGDAESYRGPVPWHFGDLIRGFAGYRASLGDGVDGRVRVVFTSESDPDVSFLVDVDPALGVIVEVTSIREDKVEWRRRFEAFHDVGGVSWPASVIVLDGDGRETERTELVVEDLADEALSSAIAAELARRDDALLLPEDEPDEGESRAAVAAGTAVFADRWRLLRHFMADDRFDEARPHFEAIDALLAGKRGQIALRAAWQLATRRLEELKVLLTAAASDVADQPRDTELSYAAWIVGNAGRLNPGNERLALLDVLRPIYLRHPDVPDVGLPWDYWRVAALKAAGRHSDGYEHWERMAVRYPYVPDVQAAYAGELARRGGVDAAVTWLRDALAKNGPWNDAARSRLQVGILDILWDGYRLEQVVETCEQWLGEEPDEYDGPAATRYLSALRYLDREARAWAIAKSWMAAALAAGDVRSRPRLQAAISHALGQGHGFYGYYYGQRLDPSRVVELADVARRLAHHDVLRADAGSIITYHWFRNTDDGRAVAAELLDELSANLASLPVDAVVTWVQWLFGSRVVNEETQTWAAIFEGLYARYLAGPADERLRLRQVLLSYAGQEIGVRLRRHDLDTASDERARSEAAFELFTFLMRGGWTDAIEEELFTLLPKLAHDGGDEASLKSNLHRRIIAVYDLADWLPRARRDAKIAALPGVNEMPRRLLAAARDRELRAAREATVTRLQRFEAAASDEAGRAIAILERLYLLVKLDQDTDAVRRAAWELASTRVERWCGQDETPPVRDEMIASRAIATLVWLMVQAASPEASEDERNLLELLSRCSGEAKNRRIDGDSWRYIVLLALDRGEALEALLRGFAASDLPAVRDHHATALAYLYAERGDLDRAIRAMLAVAGWKDLASDDYQALARWRTALGDEEGARDARLSSYEAQSNRALHAALRNELSRYQPNGDEPPAPLDPEVPRRFVVLLRKSTRPPSDVGLLQAYHDATKDFRLLEGIPDAMVGHSAQGVYPMLEALRGLLATVQEEATLDRMRARIDVVSEQARTTIDQRALGLLEFLVASRAAQQTNGAERHVDAALEALQVVQKEAWEDGEPALMAQFLAALGAIEAPALAEEHRRLVRALVGAAKGEDERLAVTTSAARVLWGYQQRGEAARMIEGALRELRQGSGGGLPNTANSTLTLYAEWCHELGEFAAAEREWLVELRGGPEESQRLWLIERLHETYRAALLHDGAVSLGAGEALYGAVLDSFRKELTVITNEHHAANMVSQLCQTWIDLHGKRRTGFREDAVRFAFHDFPEVLNRYQHRGAPGMVGRVSDCLLNVVNALTALEFLTVRAENEPEWLYYQGHNFWASQCWRYESARAAAGNDVTGALESRVLAVVLDELTADLTSGVSRARAMYDRNRSQFWSEKADVFHRAALSIIEAQPRSGPITDHVASYLYHGLAKYDDAIRILTDAHRRGVLTIDGRRNLARYLQGQSRWLESAPILDGLIEDLPSDIEVRVMRMLASARDGDPEGAAVVLAAAEAWLREHDPANEASIAALGSGAMNCDLHEAGIRLLGEAIALHVKLAADRGVGDGVLSRYYRDQAEALAGLGRTDEAVDAAAGAIVSWGNSYAQRQQELRRLTEVLVESPDLDGYVERFERTVRETGLENPIVRKALAQAYLSVKRPESAAQQATTGLETTPDDDELHLLLLSAYDQMKRPEQAASAALSRAVQLARAVEPYLEAGRRFEQLERPVDAERARTSVIEMLPQESEAYAALADVRRSNGRLVEAIEGWRQVVRIRDNEPTGRLALAECLIEAGRADDARKVIDELITRSWPERFGDVAKKARELLAGLDR